ncbi:hypothetical protein FO519_008604 [Halicephalobus sp. NKZ332]|nr:hypothetical protein FO519_008604 [Halicephalobus sp. NKZ332]
MGIATSRGQNNLELVDNLVNSENIESAAIEFVFRLVDRGLYIPETAEGIYDSAPWRARGDIEQLFGPLHLSAPSIYTSILEHLDLQKGQSFLNIGSGLGYLSTMAGFFLGSSGVSHGVEINKRIYEYALQKRTEFLQSPVFSCFDFCIPEHFHGNGFQVKLNMKYDRIYVGAQVPIGMRMHFVQMLKVGGVCIMPYDRSLQRIRRSTEKTFLAYDISPVEFGTLIIPSLATEMGPDYARKEVEIPGAQIPRELNEICRAAIREFIRESRKETVIIRQKLQIEFERRERYPYDVSEDEMLGEQPDPINVFDNDHRMNPERTDEGYTIYTLQRPRIRHVIRLVERQGDDDDDVNIVPPIDQRGMDIRDGLQNQGANEELQQVLEHVVNRVFNGTRNRNNGNNEEIMGNDEEATSSDARPPEPPRSQSAPVQPETARLSERRHIREHIEQRAREQQRLRETSGSSTSSSQSSSSSNGVNINGNRKRKAKFCDEELMMKDLRTMNCALAPLPFRRRYVRVLPTTRVEELAEEISRSDSLQKMSIELFDAAFKKSINSLDLPQKMIGKLLYEDVCEKKEKINEEKMIVDNE